MGPNPCWTRYVLYFCSPFRSSSDFICSAPAKPSAESIEDIPDLDEPGDDSPKMPTKDLGNLSIAAIPDMDEIPDMEEEDEATAKPAPKIVSSS